MWSKGCGAKGECQILPLRIHRFWSVLCGACVFPLFSLWAMFLLLGSCLMCGVSLSVGVVWCKGCGFKEEGSIPTLRVHSFWGCGVVHVFLHGCPYELGFWLLGLCLMCGLSLSVGVMWCKVCGVIEEASVPPLRVHRFWWMWFVACELLGLCLMCGLILSVWDVGSKGCGLNEEVSLPHLRVHRFWWMWCGAFVFPFCSL